MLELPDGAVQDNVTFPIPGAVVRSVGIPGTAKPELGVADIDDV
jgi:hypothetical protein